MTPPPPARSRTATLLAVLGGLLLSASLVYYLTRDASVDGGTAGSVEPPAARQNDGEAPDATSTTGGGSTSRPVPARPAASDVVARRSIVTATVGAIESCATRRTDGLYSGGLAGPDCLGAATLRRAEPALTNVDLRVGSSATIRQRPRPAGSIWVFGIRDRSPGTTTSGLILGYSVALGIPLGPGPKARIGWFVTTHRPNGRLARTCAIGGGITASGVLDGAGATDDSMCPRGQW